MRNFYVGSRMAARSHAGVVGKIVMYLVLGRGLALSSLRSAQQTMQDSLDDVPMAGDLVRHVKEQLASDHRALGKVSKSLMSIQSSVDKTEESMLGKVLDLQTARSFFSRHEEIDISNEKMKEDVQQLNTQVEDLSSTLSKVQKEFLANAAKNLKSEGKLKSQGLENKEMIEAMNAELAKEDDVQKELKRLSKIHEDLMKEAVEALKAGKKSVDMLKEARRATKTEVGKHRSLRHQLVQMNNYSVACHTKVQKQSKKLGQMMMKESKDSKASTMTLEQKRKANQATQQRLLAERALLVSEVKKYEREEKEEIERMRDLREDMKVLEANILKEVRSVEDKLKDEKERLVGLRTGLMENAQAEAGDLDQKEVVDNAIRGLQNKIREDENPVIIATTEGQNEALQAELTQAYAMWKKIKAGETMAVLDRDEAATEVKAAKEGLRMAQKGLETAKREGRSSLAEAVDKANRNKAKAQALIDKAQGVIAGRCKPKWDAIWKKKQKKLTQCKVWESSLEMETAKKDVLMQTAKAQAEAGF